MCRFVILLSLLIASLLVQADNSAALEIKVYAGKQQAFFPNSILILGKKEAVLIDAQWWLSEGKNVADMIEQSGRQLTTILITHGHPDHYWGLGPIVERFPEVKVLARRPIRDEILYEFPAKRMHWQEMYPHETPMQAIVPEIFDGDSITLEGHEIRFIDLPPAETIHATAFYIPSLKSVVTGDLIFSNTHSYLADINNPTSWIKAINVLRKIGPIETVYPGHGPVAGPELFDQAIHYMQVYREKAQPGVRIAEIARHMTQRFPDYKGEMILWLTRGPAFGPAGAEQLGVPEHIFRKH